MSGAGRRSGADGGAGGEAGAGDVRELPQWLQAAFEASVETQLGETPVGVGGGAAAMDEFAARMRECRACALCETRVNVVVGAGNPCADVMFVGEAPGKNEDEQGAPFVGSAGKNLDALLELAGLSRADVYIANVLKCRPPANRNPRAAEVEACAPWLAAQIAAVRPDIVVTLGNFATRLLLGVKDGIGELHGSVREMGPFVVVPMFHPAAVIYDRSKTELVREDFRRLGVLLDGEGECGELRGVACGGRGEDAVCGEAEVHAGGHGGRDAHAGYGGLSARAAKEDEGEGERPC